MAAAAGVLAQADALAARLAALRPPAAPAGDRTERELALETALAGAKGAVEAAGDLLESLKAALKPLAVTETLEERAVAIPAQALARLVAGRLIERDLKPVLPSRRLTGTALPPQLRALANAAAAMDPAVLATPEGAALKQEVEALLAGLADNATLNGGLALVRQAEGSPSALLLVVECLSAGGVVRARRHLLTLVGLAEPLSMSAGVALSYTLGEAATGALLASDIAYHASGRVRLSSGVQERPLTTLPMSLSRFGLPRIVED